MGLWEADIKVGYGYAIGIAFGKNAGQWNFGFAGGIGMGVSVGVDMSENDPNRMIAEDPCYTGTSAGLGMEISAGAGIDDVTIGGNVGGVNGNGRLDRTYQSVAIGIVRPGFSEKILGAWR